MKITSIKEVTVEDAKITITINPNSQKTGMTLSYTCHDCAGHGCRSHGNTTGGNPDCHGGNVSMVLDPSKIDRHLDAATALKVKAAVQNLLLEMTGD
jgi:predicted nucleic acid binding AN1-type Zn finger protein